MKTDKEIKKMTVDEVEVFISKNQKLARDLRKCIPGLKAVGLEFTSEEVKEAVDELEELLGYSVGRLFPLHVIIGLIMEWNEDNEPLIGEMVEKVTKIALEKGIDVSSVRG